MLLVTIFHYPISIRPARLLLAVIGLLLRNLTGLNYYSASLARPLFTFTSIHFYLLLPTTHVADFDQRHTSMRASETANSMAYSFRIGRYGRDPRSKISDVRSKANERRHLSHAITIVLGLFCLSEMRVASFLRTMIA